MSGRGLQYQKQDNFLSRKKGILPKQPDEITIAIPGGLAGQIFGVSYALWRATRYKDRIHIRFHDMGTNISGMSVAGLVETDTVKNLGISYSLEGTWLDFYEKPLDELVPQEIHRHPLLSWITALDKSGASLARNRGLFYLARYLTAKVSRGDAPKLLISKRRLARAQPGELVIGYPSDLSVIDESWLQLAKALSESDHPNFIHDAGTEEFVAIHWRHGDFVNNDFHGVVTWESILACLDENNLLNKKLLIFTDSPWLVEQKLRENIGGLQPKVISEAIWDDIYHMSRARFFVGTNSQVSLLVAYSVLRAADTSRTKVFLPRPFFKSSKWERFFHPSSALEAKATFYDAEFY